MFNSTKQLVVPNDVVSELSAIEKLTSGLLVTRPVATSGFCGRFNFGFVSPILAAC
jgi:hypothetical protein